MWGSKDRQAGQPATLVHGSGGRALVRSAPAMRPGWLTAPTGCMWSACAPVRAGRYLNRLAAAMRLRLARTGWESAALSWCVGGGWLARVTVWTRRWMLMVVSVRVIML